MTLVKDTGGSGEPRTHALVIGVGAYRHLKKGVAPVANERLRLSQLSSPPLSARAFADWLLKDYDNPQARLGTVELLLSQRQPTKAEYEAGTPTYVPYVSPNGSTPIQVESATIANIRAAHHRWRKRCDEHPGNVAMFYYCGHGVFVESDHILLAEDYGANELKHFEGSFNFDALRRGLPKCTAGVQCCFVDACNNVSVQGLLIADSGTEVLAETSRTGLGNNQILLVVEAARVGKSAYANTGQVSRFTEALIRCLNGLAAKPRGKKWVVYTSNVHGAVTDIVEHLEEIKGGPSQIPTIPMGSGKAIIHERWDPPLVPVVLQLHPDTASERAALVLNGPVARTGFPMERIAKHVGKWYVDNVPAGQYELAARFPNGGFREHNEEIRVDPPGPHPYPDSVDCQEAP